MISKKYNKTIDQIILKERIIKLIISAVFIYFVAYGFWWMLFKHQIQSTYKNGIVLGYEKVITRSKYGPSGSPAFLIELENGEKIKTLIPNGQLMLKGKEALILELHDLNSDSYTYEFIKYK